MTCSRPAPPGWKPCWGWRTRSSSGRSSRALPAGWTPPRTPRLPSARDCGSILLDLSRAKTAGPAAGHPLAAPAQGPCPGRALHRGTAHRAVDGRAPGADHGAVEDQPPGAGRTGAGQPPEPRSGLRARLLRRPADAIPRPGQGFQSAGRYLAGEAGQAQTGLRPEPGLGGHHDRRELHAADGWRIDGAARL